jgi:serine/threonine-protein kinase
MTRQPSRRRPDVATAAILGLAIAITFAIATAGASGVSAGIRRTGPRASTVLAPIAAHDIAVGGHPNAVAIDPRRRAVWVSTPQLVRISEATQRITARVRTIQAGAVAVDPGTGMVWAINNADGTMAEVSEATNRVIHRFPSLGFTRAIAIDPVHHTVWVTSNSSVVEFSEATRRIVHSVALHMDRFQILGALSVDPRTRTVWATVIPGGPGSAYTWISEISETTHHVLHVYPYAGLGNYSAVTAVDSARGTVWVSIGAGGTTGIIKVIDIATHRVVRTISNLTVDPGGLAIDPSAHLVLATARTSTKNMVLLLSESSGKVTGQVTTGLLPADVAVDPGTRYAYVPVAFRAMIAEFRD